MSFTSRRQTWGSRRFPTPPTQFRGSVRHERECPFHCCAADRQGWLSHITTTSILKYKQKSKRKYKITSWKSINLETYQKDINRTDNFENENSYIITKITQITLNFNNKFEQFAHRKHNFIVHKFFIMSSITCFYGWPIVIFLHL